MPTTGLAPSIDRGQILPRVRSRGGEVEVRVEGVDDLGEFVERTGITGTGDLGVVEDFVGTFRFQDEGGEQGFGAGDGQLGVVGVGGAAGRAVRPIVGRRAE